MKVLAAIAVLAAIMCCSYAAKAGDDAVEAACDESSDECTSKCSTLDASGFVGATAACLLLCEKERDSCIEEGMKTPQEKVVEATCDEGYDECTNKCSEFYDGSMIFGGFDVTIATASAACRASCKAKRNSCVEEGMKTPQEKAVEATCDKGYDECTSECSKLYESGGMIFGGFDVTIATATASCQASCKAERKSCIEEAMKTPQEKAVEATCDEGYHECTSKCSGSNSFLYPYDGLTVGVSDVAFISSANCRASCKVERGSCIEEGMEAIKENPAQNAPVPAAASAIAGNLRKIINLSAFFGAR